MISNEKIMQKKPKEDKLEEGFSITTKSYYKDGKQQKETRQGIKEDFLDEIEYGDSVIIDVQNDSIRKIYPDDIIEEIRKYIKSNDNNDTRNRKIQTAMKFFNESTEQNSSEYIQEFFKLVRRKESQRNK
jgi:hypothetical protein